MTVKYDVVVELNLVKSRVLGSPRIMAREKYQFEGLEFQTALVVGSTVNLPEESSTDRPGSYCFRARVREVVSVPRTFGSEPNDTLILRENYSDRDSFDSADLACRTIATSRDVREQERRR